MAEVLDRLQGMQREGREASLLCVIRGRWSCGGKQIVQAMGIWHGRLGMIRMRRR